MKRIDDNCIFIDVDDTLILSEYGELLSEKSSTNFKLVEKIKEWYTYKTVIVWTSNSEGSRHAEKIVIELGLSNYVDFVMPKPTTIVDDDHLEYYNIIDPRTLEYK